MECVCKHCGRVCKNGNSLRNHERLCKQNPNHQENSWVKYNQSIKNGKHKISNQYTHSTNGLLEYKKYHYFYKITNLINGKYYYGIHSTDELDDQYLGSGLRLNLAYKKYGIENFKKEVLKMFETRKEASEYEKVIVDENKVNSNECYNLTTGGDKGFCNAFKGKHHTLETKSLLSAKLTIPDDKLVLKRRMMNKDGIKKSVKLDEIDKYKSNGWKLGGSNSSYVHTQKEYLNILKENKRKRIEKETKIKQERIQENEKIHDLLLNVAKDNNIYLDKFGWNKIIIKILNDNGIMIKSNIRRFINRHCPEFFELKKVYDKA